LYSISDYAIDVIFCGLGCDTAYINYADHDMVSEDYEDVISTSVEDNVVEKKLNLESLLLLAVIKS
jgi:hypothetical protein